MMTRTQVFAFLLCVLGIVALVLRGAVVKEDGGGDSFRRKLRYHGFFATTERQVPRKFGDMFQDRSQMQGPGSYPAPYPASHPYPAPYPASAYPYPAPYPASPYPYPYPSPYPGKGKSGKGKSGKGKSRS
uniref:Uncharacterized protein n=1 Tax=Cyclophora tenuis TaxID=216820 RepID=A0A7S1GK66_CYCTE